MEFQMADTEVAQAPEAAPVEADPAAPEANEAPEVAAQDAPAEPEKSYTQADLDRIVAKVKKNTRYATKREMEAFQQGAASARQPERPAQPAQQQADPKPTRDQFESYESFLEATADYTARNAAAKERARLDAEATAKEQRDAQVKRATDFQKRVLEKYPDLPDRVAEIGDMTMPAGMSDAIAESDLGPEILNHFASNPKDFERIAALSPSAAIREVGKLEARLEGPKSEPAPKAASKAPAPVKPVGGSAVTGDDDLSKLVNDPEKWLAARNRQIAKRTQGRS